MTIENEIEVFEDDMICCVCGLVIQPCQLLTCSRCQRAAHSFSCGGACRLCLRQLCNRCFPGHRCRRGLYPCDTLTKPLSSEAHARCLDMIEGWSRGPHRQVEATMIEIISEPTIEEEQFMEIKEHNYSWRLSNMIWMTTTFCALVWSALLAWKIFEICYRRCLRREEAARTVATQSEMTYTELRGALRPRFVKCKVHEAG